MSALAEGVIIALVVFALWAFFDVRRHRNERSDIPGRIVCDCAFPDNLHADNICEACGGMIE